MVLFVFQHLQNWEFVSTPLSTQNYCFPGNQPPSAISLMVACVADAVNLLYIADYTNGLDECVSRLQRRLSDGSLPFSAFVSPAEER